MKKNNNYKYNILNQKQCYEQLYKNLPDNL